MTIPMVPVSSIIAIVFTLVVSVVLPWVMLVVIRRKFHADILPFFIGCGVFFVTVMVLEQAFHALAFRLAAQAGIMLQSNIWLYALYGGLAAGLFEESARWITMKFLMRRNLTRENALMYGAGHGGVEAMLIVGLVYINNLVISILINTGNAGLLLQSVPNPEEVMAGLAPLSVYPAWMFFISGIERLLAMALHICLSVFVYTSVRNRKMRYYGIAVLLHAGVNFTAVVLSGHGYAVLAEVATFVWVALITAFAIRLYRSDNNLKKV